MLHFVHRPSDPSGSSKIISEKRKIEYRSPPVGGNVLEKGAGPSAVCEHWEHEYCFMCCVRGRGRDRRAVFFSATGRWQRNSF